MRDSDDRHDRFRDLYEQHYPAVLRYAARRVARDAASDVAADTFLTAWRRLDDVPVREPLPWLYATARRCLANELRGQGRSDRLGNRMRDEASAGLGSVPDRLADSVADRLDVLAALATLPAQAQEALRLTQWEQLDDVGEVEVAGAGVRAGFRGDGGEGRGDGLRAAVQDAQQLAVGPLARGDLVAGVQGGGCLADVAGLSAGPDAP